MIEIGNVTVVMEIVEGIAIVLLLAGLLCCLLLVIATVCEFSLAREKVIWTSFVEGT